MGFLIHENSPAYLIPKATKGLNVGAAIPGRAGHVLKTLLGRMEKILIGKEIRERPGKGRESLGKAQGKALGKAPPMFPIQYCKRS